MTSIIVNAQRIDLVLLCVLVSHGQKCEEGHFACPSGNCISSVWLCDGQKDCEDGADEFQCGKPKRSSTQSLYAKLSEIGRIFIFH